MQALLRLGQGRRRKPEGRRALTATLPRGRSLLQVSWAQVVCTTATKGRKVPEVIEVIQVGALFVCIWDLEGGGQSSHLVRSV